MPNLHIDILESSFAKINPNMNNFATSFYDNLFMLYPEAKPLFANTNMEAQKQKLMDSLKTVILNARINSKHLDELLRGLGSRHIKYGALPEHYPLVGNALLQTFEEYLGEEWTSEVKQAWVEAYGIITELMLEGAAYVPENVSLDSVPLEEKDNLPDEISPSLMEEELDNSEDIIEEEETVTYENKINWTILIGFSTIIIVALTAVIFTNLHKDKSPSSNPSQSFLID